MVCFTTKVLPALFLSNNKEKRIKKSLMTVANEIDMQKLGLDSDLIGLDQKTILEHKLKSKKMGVDVHLLYDWCKIN